MQVDDPGDDRLQGVLDGLAVEPAEGVRVTPGLPCRRALLRHGVEDRAVAELVPGHHVRQRGPRVVRGDEVDLGHHGGMPRRELEPLERGQDELVGHRGPAERRALVTEVEPAVDLVVVVEGRSLRPRPVVGGVDADGAPARLAEGAAERAPVAGHELVVARLGCRSTAPTAGSRERASCRHRRRGSRSRRCAPGQSGLGQPRGAAAQDGGDAGSDIGALDGDLPVALDEDDEDVLAAQAGQRVRHGESPPGRGRGWPPRSAAGPAGSPGHLVRGRQPVRRCPSRRSGPAGTSCSDSAAHTAHTTPRTATPPAERRRCRAMALLSRTVDAVTRTISSMRARPARTRRTSVAVAPIESRTTPIAGPNEPQSTRGLNGRPSCTAKPTSRSLTTVSSPSTTPAATATIRLGLGGRRSPIPTRTSPSSGMRTKAAGVIWSSRVGATRTAQTTAAATSAGGQPHSPAGARAGAGAVQPDDAAAERLGQQDQGGADRDHADRAGQDPGDRDGEDDALDGGDDLAPVPGRQRCGQPRDRPPRDQQHVAGGADGQHPVAVVPGHRDAQHEDEEGVGLTVEAGPEGRGGPRAARHLPVHGVEQEREGGEDDQRGNRQRPVRGIGDESRDPGAQQRPGQGDPVRREDRLPAANPAGGQQRGCRPAGGQSDAPTGGVEAGGQGEDAEEGGRGERRRGPSPAEPCARRLRSDPQPSPGITDVRCITDVRPRRFTRITDGAGRPVGYPGDLPATSSWWAR